MSCGSPPVHPSLATSFFASVKAFLLRRVSRLVSSDGWNTGVVGDVYSFFEPFRGQDENPVLPGPFQHVSGYCWSAEVSYLASLADSLQNNNCSPLALFEDGLLLEQSHALHAEIARVGKGRYSHWGTSLYFSSADNSNPNCNGRSYSFRKRRQIEQVLDEEMLTQIAMNDWLMYRLISRGINTNAHPLNQVLFSYRQLKNLLALTGESHFGKVLFEIGSSPRLGLPLIFALTGAKRYVANNVVGISREVSANFLQLLQLMLIAIEGKEHLRDISDIVSNVQHGSTEAARLVDTEFVQIIDQTPAELADIESNSVDIVFSQSVLEHVSDPIAVLRKSFDVMKPGAYAYHSVDLTEHGSVCEPLRFLKETREDYEKRTGAPENRVRYREYIDLFKQVGFEMHSIRLYTKLNEHQPNGSVDITKYMETGFKQDESYTSLDEVVPWVDDTYKSQFAAPFNCMDNRNLSVLYFDVVCRKPNHNPTNSFN